MSIEAPQRSIRLLEVSPDLGADLEGQTFEDALRLTVCPLVSLPEGEWDPAELARAPGVHGRVFGAVVADGLIVRETLLGDRVCTHLYGPTEFMAPMRPDGVSPPARCRWAVSRPAKLAVLDNRFLVAIRRWPWIAGRLVDCAGSQLARAHTGQAISQLPRIEDRLVALFWLLAERWGHARADCIEIDLPLTHDALGRLVGARRPTVSLGLQQLADRGLLQRADTRWILASASLEALVQDPVPAARLRSPLSERMEAPVVPGDSGPPLSTAPRAARVKRLKKLPAEMLELQSTTAQTLEQGKILRSQLAARWAALAETRGQPPA